MPRSTFSDAELAYLHSGRRLARIATIGTDGMPHVVPTGWVHNPRTNTIDVTGHHLDRTKKYRDVQHIPRAAVVIDDLADAQTWSPRAIEIRGRAEPVRTPEPLIRIHPEHIVSWGLEKPR